MNNFKNVICWWSGGATSAVACKLAIDLFGIDRCSIIMIDTFNEGEDAYRFKADCEKWYGKEIQSITAIGKKYNSIQEVWIKNKSLNVANGAICSATLKREVRIAYQKKVKFDAQVFGFEFDKSEFNRAKSMSLNYPEAKPIFPLLMFGYDKLRCIQIIEEAGIEIPITYRLGFNNANCFETGCVQGGIGYWQKMMRDSPKKFDAMADLEHKLTNAKGSPVTMLKDQSNEAKLSGNKLVFLKKHPDYPHLKSISEMPECVVQPLKECNGFCGINDLNKVNPTQNEINYQEE